MTAPMPPVENCVGVFEKPESERFAMTWEQS